MAASIIRQFVIKHLMKQGAKKDGIMQILKASDEAVDLSVQQIEQTLKNMGVDATKLTSEKQLLGYLNFQESLMKQKTKKLKDIESKFFDPSGKMKPEGEAIVKEGLEGLGKKKDPFMGANLKIVPKEQSGKPEHPQKLYEQSRGQPHSGCYVT